MTRHGNMPLLKCCHLRFISNVSKLAMMTLHTIKIESPLSSTVPMTRYVNSIMRLILH